MSSWYERNKTTESDADPGMFYGAIFNAYRPEPKTGALVLSFLASQAGSALGNYLGKAKGK